MRFKDPLVWFAGLVSAFLSGGAGAVTSGLSAIMIAPDKFNIQAGLENTLKLMAVNFIVAGCFGFFTRLQKSPLPDVIQTDTTITTRAEVQGEEPILTVTRKTSVQITKPPNDEIKNDGIN